jgi:hypothetical protein
MAGTTTLMKQLPTSEMQMYSFTLTYTTTSNTADVVFPTSVDAAPDWLIGSISNGQSYDASHIEQISGATYVSATRTLTILRHTSKSATFLSGAAFRCLAIWFNNTNQTDETA